MNRIIFLAAAAALAQQPPPLPPQTYPVPAGEDSGYQAIFDGKTLNG